MLDKGMGGKISTGIYRLMFDDYFYIGRSQNIRTRAKQHTKELEIMLSKDNPKSNYQRNMLKFLKDNPEFNLIKLEILELCAESELHEKEAYWLSKSSCDTKCLNLTFNAKRTWKDKAASEFKAGIYTVDFNISTVKQLLDLKKLLNNYGVDIKLKK